MLNLQKGVQVNTIIWFGKYRVIRPLGQGATSTVYLARHEKLDCCRAIKQIAKYKAPDAHYEEEAHILKNLRHPNIPIIYDIEEDDTYIYIVEEYVEGQSLRALRLSHNYISESKIKEYLIQLCDVLIFLHSNEQPILYLDLKPDNIIISDGLLKLVDFGAAIFSKDIHKRRVSLGTRGYAAPEQYGMQQIDKRSDVYGVGGVLYFLVTGTVFGGSQDALKGLECEVHCSKQLIKIIKKCLKPLPIERYQSIQELKKQAIKHKGGILPKPREEQTPHVIFVAGMLPRCGVTHISLMITAYLNRKGISAVYVENNDSYVVEKLQKSGIANLPPAIRASVEDIRERFEEYMVYVCDLGQIYSYRDNPWNKKPCDNEKRFLILGTKPWEWRIPIKAEKTEYLFNFTNKQDFAYVSGLYHNIRCYRVPFENEFTEPYKNPLTAEFMEEILEDFYEEKKSSFFTKIFRKGR